MVDPQLLAAYEHCGRLVRGHYENFPVASVLVPEPMRPHIAAIYAFARMADDFADKPGRPAAIRLQLLDHWGARLRMSPPPGDHVFVALRDTIERCALPVELFEDLLSAFRQDVTVQRYETWEDVLDYCRRSANPVGRLVLRVAGVHREEADATSDAVCTALQLTNFWQDFGDDWRNGRLYVPTEELRIHGASEADLGGAAMTPPWRAAMHASVERTRQLFAAGRPVTAAVRGRLRWELRATWLGGMRILDKIEAREFDTLHNRPRLTAADAAAIALGVVGWRRTRPRQRFGAPG